MYLVKYNNNQMKIGLIIILAYLFYASNSVDLNTTYDTQIYGVRWFLGNRFQFQEPVTVHHKRSNKTIDLMLMFNTYEHQADLNFTVKIQQISFSCSDTTINTNITANHHPHFNNKASKIGSTFQTYVYRCPVWFRDQDFLSKIQKINYQIYSHSQLSLNKIFQSALRSPKFQENQFSALIFGDWGQITNFSSQYNISQPITQCLIAQKDNHKNVRLMVLLGDLAYDLEGQTYINFMEHLQTFSQQIAILLTAGNHQSIKHSDIFQLFKESFYSPYWDQFYGYFDLVVIGKFIFLGYNPQNVFTWLGRESNSSIFDQLLKDDYKTYYHLFQSQLTPSTIQDIKRNYTLISYSHYPIYCSQQDSHESCNKYRRLQGPYYQKLAELGVDLVFSGHLHVYQRSKPICKLGDYFKNEYQKGKQTKDQIYFDPECAIFILEGAAGNNYYVQSDRHFELREYNRNFIENTGFGVITLNRDGKNKIYFKHISIDNGCKIADSFTLMERSLQISANTWTSNDNDVVYTVAIGLIIVTVVIVVKLIKCKVISIFRKNKQEEDIKLKSCENVMQLSQLEQTA